MKRRQFLQMGSLGVVVTSSTVIAKSQRLPTPSEIEGPFYPLVAQ